MFSFRRSFRRSTKRKTGRQRSSSTPTSPNSIERNEHNKEGASVVNSTNPRLLKTAQDELQEKPEWRERDIQALREMVLCDKGLHAPMDDAFLLRFLRARKFDYERSFQLLQQYFLIRAHNAELYANFRPSVVMNVFNDNMQIMLPHRDELGRKVFLFRAGKWDPNHCTPDDIFRANQMCLEHAIKEEETQINGIVAIVDMKDFGLTQAKHVRPAYTKKVISLIQDCFPARFKGFHFVNNPAIFDLIFVVLKPFLNEKIKERVFFHGSSLESLHEHVPPEILPEELGGMQPATDNTSFVKSLLALDDKFESDITNYGYEQPQQSGTSIDGIVGNYYRKLCIE